MADTTVTVDLADSNLNLEDLASSEDAPASRRKGRQYLVSCYSRLSSMRDTTELVEQQKCLVLQLQDLGHLFPPGASADVTHNWLLDVKIPQPMNSAGQIIHWSHLKFNPVGLNHLRRWLGVCPLHPGFFNTNQARFRAADLAWFSAGAHCDDHHMHPPGEFHPAQISLMRDTNGSAAGRTERKEMHQETEKLVWDLLTMLDRTSGSTSLLMRCQGTVVPGAPPAPEYIKSHVYFPPAFLAHNPDIQPWLRTVCQGFVEKVGVPTVSSWYQRCRAAFGWSLNQAGHPAPNLTLSSPSVFPVPLPGTSHFVYPGQPQHRNKSSIFLTSSLSREYFSSDEDWTEHDDQIISLQEDLAHSQMEVIQLQARISVLESGAGILARSVGIPAPITPTRKSHSTTHSSFGQSFATSILSPHVTIRHSRQNTPSKVRFITPPHSNCDELEPESLCDEQELRPAPSEIHQSPGFGQRIDNLSVTRVLQACGLEHKAKIVKLVLRTLPSEFSEADLVSHLISDADIPAPSAHRIAAAVILDKVHLSQYK